ncbi:unnamed protein product, partial [marine sediment metagenome]
ASSNGEKIRIDLTKFGEFEDGDVTTHLDPDDFSMTLMIKGRVALRCRPEQLHHIKGKIPV